ncbi:MAG: response regulator transcription factor [Propionibacteriaceae bacterium]
MITVVVADDQALIRTALASMLSLEDDLEVVGQAGTTAAVVALAGSLAPDVIVMDVQMPHDGGPEDGIAATAAIMAASPHTRVIIVTTFGRPGYLRRAMEAGAVGFIVKDAPADRLIDGIRRVAQGLRVVDPELAVASLSIGPSPLSVKEAEVLRACEAGVSTAAVAAMLYLSEGTVRNYLSVAIGKVGAANRAEAIRVASDNGWL